MQCQYLNIEVPYCRGVYELQPKAFMGRTTISGPKIKISIQADMTKPVSLTVEYDKNASYTVSEHLPGLSSTVKH